jgi:hypothetical protein
VFDVCRELNDVIALAVAAVKYDDLGVHAVHPSIAASGDECDAAVGQVAGLIVVELAACELRDIAAVDVYLVEVMVDRFILTPGEEYLLCVVMHVRIADRAAFRVEKHGYLAGPHVQLAQSAVVRAAFTGEHQSCLIVAPVANIGVPVPVLVCLAVREHDLFDAMFDESVRSRDRCLLCGRDGRAREQAQARSC